MNEHTPAAAATIAVTIPIYSAVLFALGACSAAVSSAASLSLNGSSDDGSMGSAAVGSTVVGSVDCG